MSPKKAVCLLSGGLDSATSLYIAKSGGYDCKALSIDYGQRHAREMESARRIAAKAGAEWRELSIQLPWKGSALLDSLVELPKGRDEKEMASEIPVSYVPARNTIFLSFALSWAEVCGASAVFIGANALDYSGYPDCRSEYFEAMERVFGKGTKAGDEGKKITIEAPLLKMSKADIIRKGHGLGVPYELTWSCYEGKEAPCGVCDSCILRQKGFREAGLEDPLLKLSAK